MRLTDPRDALADHSDFVGYLVGLAAMADMIRSLAATDRRAEPVRDCDDFRYALLGLASVGSAIERMANCVAQPPHPSRDADAAARPTRYLR
ncbi:hypothetical protein [Mycobacterium sp. SA01]|uniref:hypothetical protein n=1 Tax=Mycobacterium sp. SA01 TaxID=3238820 RepID=UPI00351B4992